MKWAFATGFITAVVTLISVIPVAHRRPPQAGQRDAARRLIAEAGDFESCQHES